MTQSPTMNGQNKAGRSTATVQQSCVTVRSILC